MSSSSSSDADVMHEIFCVREWRQEVEAKWNLLLLEEEKEVGEALGTYQFR